jgi:CO/xanthine dehydrogenase FAD-binding subunit
VKPPAFSFVVPRSVDEAVAALTQHGEDAKVLAGGQSLVPLMNLRLASPGVLVDINQIADLAYVRPWDGGVSIGALTRQHAAERAPEIRAHLPIVREACHLIGHLPIRHRGTVGGNLAHGDPASELPAVMVALEAELALVSSNGSRTVPAEQFFVGELTTALRPDELLAEVRVPGLPARTGGAFMEIARRHGDYALVGVAALITLDEAGGCQRARLALCGAGPTPIPAREAEQVLVGQQPGGAALDAAAERAAAAADPPSDIHASAAFRRKLVRYVTRQAIELATQRAGGV